jgi:hypothetical protein
VAAPLRPGRSCAGLHGDVDVLGSRDFALTEESAGWSPGFHLGALGGIRIFGKRAAYAIELGFVYRRIVYELAYQNDAGARASRELVAQPISLLLGASWVFLL